jgi:hypothetical protein
VTAELLELNQAWTKAWLEGDARVVDSLMAPGYVYIAPNGQVLDRQKILSIIRSPRYHLFVGARTEVGVTPLGTDSAVVHSRWKGEGSYEGQGFHDDHRCTTILLRREGRWQVILEHCSAISESPNQ